MSIRYSAYVLALLLSSAAGTNAQDPGGISLSGALVEGGLLARVELTALPAVEVDVTFTTSKGQESAHYKGALLWDIFQDRGLAELEGYHEELKHTFMVTASDDYEIAFSFGEIAPDFGNRQILIAYERDHVPLADNALRIVVPGDTRGARSVRDVVSIAVR